GIYSIMKISNNKKKCLVLGMGGHSKVVTSIIESYDEYEIVGLIDKYPENVGKQVKCYTVIGYQDELEDFIKKGFDTYFIAIGDNYIRRKLYLYLKSFNCVIPPLIHRSVKYENDLIIKEGIQLCTGVILATSVSIEENSLINSGAVIDHESMIGKNCHISTGVTITGKVEIGNNSFVGAGSTILPYVKIENDTIIGAGSVVVNNIPPNVVAYGAPAVVKRKIEL
ncbi:MAG: acetyltransferase, partial [Ignavibacteriaceae bacterium]|nr:acetyltransferase [Ignavibacteriaceae bacterium]